jgi:hypothetical protein
MVTVTVPSFATVLVRSPAVVPRQREEASGAAAQSSGVRLDPVVGAVSLGWSVAPGVGPVEISVGSGVVAASIVGCTVEDWVETGAVFAVGAGVGELVAHAATLIARASVRVARGSVIEPETPRRPACVGRS